MTTQEERHVNESVVESQAVTADAVDMQLRPAIADDVHRLKATLAEAFHEDPIFNWLMPDDASRLARSRRFFAIGLRHMALARGRVWTSNDLLGAALSMPPGAWRVPPRTTLLQGTCFGRRLGKAGRLLATMEYRHPREPHYYFLDIGVAPYAQGKGLGSALMRPTLDRCDREGLPAYLEASSERNAALYERLGFRITRELRVAGSPPLRLMLRPPDPREIKR
jgi:ribosomal protein S18 acetylase RimI-like enzyme